MQTIIPAVPPPWNLRGKAYFLLYRLPGSFLDQHGFLSDFHRKANPRGTIGNSLGGMMLVDYYESGVGPYRELLFTPGIFRFQNRWVFSISKSYVSTMESVYNGFENWGIPKELADFAIEAETPHRENWRVSVSGQTIFSMSLQTTWRWLKFLVTTALMPFTLIHPLRNQLLFTTPPAKGMARFARIVQVQTQPAYFPPLEQLSPLAVASIPHFQMQFPVPQSQPLPAGWPSTILSEPSPFHADQR